MAKTCIKCGNPLGIGYVKTDKGYVCSFCLVGKKRPKIVWKCPICKYSGQPKHKTPGSCMLELFLWVVCFPIGIAYSVWRLIGRGNYCPRCGSKNIYQKS